jgi:uncharacterized Zn finger protein
VSCVIGKRHSWKYIADIRGRTYDCLWWCRKCGAIVEANGVAKYKSIRYPIVIARCQEYPIKPPTRERD